MFQRGRDAAPGDTVTALAVSRGGEAIEIATSRQVAAPASAIDLESWVLDMGEESYRGASPRRHVSIGRWEGRGLLTVEAFGFAFIVNRQRPEEIGPELFRFRSDSDCFLARVFRVKLEVTWEMGVRPLTDNVSEIGFRLGLRFLARPLQRLARMTLVPALLRRHGNEEADFWIDEIEQRYSGP